MSFGVWRTRSGQRRTRTFCPTYLNLTKPTTAPAFNPIDFKICAASRRATINAWVEKQTEGKIQNLLGPGSRHAATRLMLTNAIYFKATLAHPFNEDSTQNKDALSLSVRKTGHAPPMYRAGDSNYSDGGTFQILDPLRSGRPLNDYLAA